MFGFSVSQLALQLSLPQTPQDLISNPIRYIFYFGTFAALAGYWLRFHRILSGAFRPTPVDLVAVFFYLAFIGLVPYALYANSHFVINGSVYGAELGLAAYLLCIAMLSLAAAVVELRNVRRGYYHFDDVERRKSWESVVVGFTIMLACGFALIVDLTLGVAAGGASTLLLVLGIRFARRSARVPSAARLRLPPPEALTNPAKAPAG